MHLARRPFSRCWLPSRGLGGSQTRRVWFGRHLPHGFGCGTGSGILAGLQWFILVPGALGCSALGRSCLGGACGRAFLIRGQWWCGAGRIAPRGPALVLGGLGAA